MVSDTLFKIDLDGGGLRRVSLAVDSPHCGVNHVHFEPGNGALIGAFEHKPVSESDPLFGYQGVGGSE